MNFKLVMLSLICATSYAQIKVTNATDQTPNADAILHLESKDNDKGLLISRLPLQSTILPQPLTAHVNGMVIYNTATTTGANYVTPGLYFNDGTKWIKLSKNKNQFGDIKNSLQQTDHNGWYLLDGRSLTSLNSNARAIASSIGLAGNLPNSTDRILKGINGGETVNTNGGSNTFTILKANLPNINYTGTTDATGAHTHTYLDNPATTINVATGTNNPIAAHNETSKTTANAGNHTHSITFALGGNNTPVNSKPKSLITNTFIYLGQ
ncbi:hypothetical protein [Empedobacter brevis]|uniref:hypothetical protein n=1 Tax=Empedobacter brevis TaxID=247 RepID=UPI00333F17F5